jgi:integrase
MKMREPHLVPLSLQALEILREIQPLTGGGRFVFPSMRTGNRPMSDNAILAALRRMGYDTQTQITGHGFRAMASTMLEQLGYDVRTIELQLSHKDTNAIRAAYKRDVSRLQIDQRARMVQAWADYLDDLKAGGHNARTVPV